MPASAKLYMNPVKWEKSDLVDIIHTMVNKLYGSVGMPSVTMGATGFGNHLFLNYMADKGPGMIMIHESDIGGIPALLIDMSAFREKKKKLLKNIAQKYGGMYLDSEESELFEEFDDPFREDEDFILKMIQKGGSHYDVLNSKQNEEIDNMIERLQKMKKEIV